ncbi:MAG: carboxypeptidase-like regulatory domain-containing protein [Candidatus Neomarinimicrobiota bacterium]|nr:carboxypeptidase-like regulatory domain-containing protein [Candidatus Neomarinimicrobiota bacterium]
MRSSLLFHIMVFLLTNTIAYSQNVNLSGFVKDASSGDPLVGANVYIVGTSLGTASNEKGFYKLPNISEGTYIVRAEYIGYMMMEDSVEIIGGSDVALDFNLKYTTIEGEEVTVTAQAKGQMDAINKQLNSSSIVNIVSADRIQELPDANAAESVARVPGVSIKREGGEGNKVVIRGLSPKYNSITVDGTRLASTDPDDRSTDLSMISQYMLEGIEVTKAGTPDLDADVLGGTVNFILKRAKPGLHANVITQGMYNGLEDSYNDNKFVFDVSNRFWQDRIGILAQLDFENRNRSSHELSASYTLPGAELDSVNELFFTGLGLYDVLRKNKRNNNTFIIDMNIPNGNISYSSLNSSIDKDILNYSTNYVFASNARNSSSGKTDSKIEVTTQTLRYKQTFFSRLHIDAFSSYSQSTNTSYGYSFNFLEPDAFTESTFGIKMQRVEQIAKFDTLNTGLNDYQYNKYFSDEKENTYGMNIAFDFRLGKQISGKLKFGNKVRTKERVYDRNNEYAPVAAAAGLAGPRDSLVHHFPQLFENQGIDPRRIPITGFMDHSYDAGNFMDGEYTMGPVADLDFMLEVFQFFKKNFGRYSPGASTIDEYIMHRLHETNTIMYDYAGEENYDASYYMVDMDIGSKFNVIAGGRTEKNKTLYDSWRSQRSALPHWVYTGERYSHERENEFWLPALFLRFKPFSWLNIRFAQTNTLTRPNYTDIIPLYQIDGPGANVDYRNPYLKPGKSENLDYSITFLQNHLGLFSIGYFEKNMKNLIYSSGRRYISDPSEHGLPEGTHKYYIQNYTSNNPYAVKLSGFEFDFQTRFWYLPSVLSGLVLNANYTITDSEVRYPRTIIEFDIDWGPPLTTTTTNIDTFYVDRLIDQPDEIINISLGYDYKGFSGRLSMLYKSNVFMRTDFWPELRQSTDDYRRWDISMKMDLPVDGLEMFLNVSNITEAVDKNIFRDRNLSLEQHYGKTIDLGFRYSF